MDEQRQIHRGLGAKAPTRRPRCRRIESTAVDVRTDIGSWSNVRCIASCPRRRGGIALTHRNNVYDYPQSSWAAGG